MNICFLDYFTLQRKIIEPKPRKVLMSSILIEKLNSHDKKNEILYIKDLIEKGENVNPFQSKKLFQTNFHDHLLYEWNIYHLHLSFQQNKKYKFFKKHGNQLLFAFISQETVIFLDTNTHQIFADDYWLKILDEEFPQYIEKYKLNDDGVELTHNLTPEERQFGWNSGVSFCMTEINGELYYSQDGRTTSGHSEKVADLTLQSMNWIKRNEAFFQSYFNQICALKDFDPIKVNFVAQFGINTLEIIETNSKMVLLTYPEQFSISAIENI